MRSCLASSIALAMAAIFLPVAGAQEEQPRQQDSSLFERIDSNKDGVLTAEEVPEERKSYFERLLRAGDKDKDGKLTRDEFTASNREDNTRRPAGETPGDQRPGRGQNFDPERAFRFMDRDGDGKISSREVPDDRRENFKANLSRTDKDGDGMLNLEEFKSGMEAMARMMGRGPNPAGPGGPPNLANAPFFRVIDANKDGKLTTEELAKAGDALKTLDRNEDGVLTPEELVPPGPPGRPGDRPESENARALPERLKQLDSNSDGKLSRDEAPERMKENFNRIDNNSDGFIDAAEAARIFGRFGGNPNDNPPRRRPQQNNPENKEKSES